ncbi:helix-turn-helix domain-containing protein [Convivina intestini]|uniref:helix-turn-helix domain-containing protein n=1 Tax=Convivina intestini TaxID=1505726 RepID=UPI0020102F02|nr:helix-turn-helix transcriptional regulator [Convivina intestini]CAH1856373.1 hypothetical protein R078131_01395 [Convivina intestini]
MSEVLTEAISQQLKDARQQQGLSLDELNQKTKIQTRYLKALEEGDTDTLPSAFYVRAFARRYAEAVGLNPDELLGESEESPIVPSDLSYAHRDDDGVVRAGVDHNESAKTRLMGWVPKIWVGLGILVGLLVVWLVITQLASSGKQSSSQSQVEVSSSSVSKASSSSSSSSSKKDEIQLGQAQTNAQQLTTTYNIAGQQAKAHKLVIKASATGTMVKVNDATSKILFNETVAANTEKTIEIPANTTAVNVQFGTVANGTVSLDGQAVAINNLPTTPAPTTWNLLLNFNK